MSRYSAHGHQPTTRKRKVRDPLASKRHGERVSDIDAACRLFLLRRCPGYQAELDSYKRGITYGRGK